MLHRRPLGAASLVLEPERRPVLEYSAPAQLIRIGELLVVLAFFALIVALMVATGWARQDRSSPPAPTAAG